MKWALLDLPISRTEAAS
uniref:Uncharacterized protein n=1 Tax=Anguilla anguilla TaxID=7936 RepID=A0A0E9SL20_ANGAN